MTSRFIGRLGVLLVVSGLYVVVAPAARALDPAPAPQVTSITVEGGTLRFVATIDGAPSDQLLDPSVIRLTVGGQPWPTSVEPLGGGKTVTRTAVLVVDTSGSMGVRGIADARAASENFLSMVPADVAVGLVTFADAAQLVVPPTVDRSAVRTALSQMRPAGNTSLYDGMQLALDALQAR